MSIERLVWRHSADCRPGEAVKPELLHILQHSLGLDQYGNGRKYRNHFCAGGKDLEKCRELVGMGLMVERKGSAITGEDPTFHVTKEGEKAVDEHSPKPPKLTRGQRRYREWLKVADCFQDWTFGDWLKSGCGDETRRRLGV